MSQSLNGGASLEPNGTTVIKQAISTSSKLNDMTTTTSHSPSYRSLSIPDAEDDPGIRNKYRPFILNEESPDDWVNNLELDTVLNMVDKHLRSGGERLKVLVLYGSPRRRSFYNLL